MGDEVRCFMVVALVGGEVLLESKPQKDDRRDFGLVAKEKLESFSPNQQLITLQSRSGMVFAETDDFLAYIVVVAPTYPERVAKQLVDKHARGVESLASDGTFVATQGSNQNANAKKAYSSLCQKLASEFEGGDKVSQVMREVDQVKGVMSENINQAMSNLESTQALDNATQEMKAQSSMFNKQAKTAKSKMWWKNMKFNLIIGAILLAIIIYLISKFTGGDDGK